MYGSGGSELFWDYFIITVAAALHSHLNTCCYGLFFISSIIILGLYPSDAKVGDERKTSHCSLYRRFLVCLLLGFFVVVIFLFISVTRVDFIA